MGEAFSPIAAGSLPRVAILRASDFPHADMPQKSTRITLPDLRRKFDSLCAHLGWNLSRLAAEVELSAGTLSEYVNGVHGHKSKEPQTVPLEKAKLFASVLQAAATTAVGPQQALDAWMDEDFEVFARLLRPRRITNLEELLAQDRRRLLVRTRIVPRGSRGILADDDAVDHPPDGVVVLNHLLQGVRFELEVEPGARLFAACATKVGWYQVAPGRRHPGNAASPWESVPVAARGPIVFDPPLGPHRFVFIQAHVAELHARSPDLPLGDPLHDAEIEQLVHRLKAAGASGWRWGEAVLNVA